MTKRTLMLLVGGIGLCLAVAFGPSSQAGATARDYIVVKQAAMDLRQGLQTSQEGATRSAPAKMTAVQFSASPQLATIVAASDPSGTFVDCSIATCTVYFSWKRTLWLNDLFNGPMKPSKQIAASLAGGVLCAFISGPVGVLCAGAVLLRYTTIADHLDHSVKVGKCSAWKYNRPVFLPLIPPVVTIVGLNSWSSFNGRTCK
jgi:hypothetical protein